MKRSSFEAGLDSFENTQDLDDDEEFNHLDIEEARLLAEEGLHTRDGMLEELDDEDEAIFQSDDEPTRGAVKIEEETETFQQEEEETIQSEYLPSPITTKIEEVDEAGVLKQIIKVKSRGKGSGKGKGKGKSESKGGSELIKNLGDGETRIIRKKKDAAIEAKWIEIEDLTWTNKNEQTPVRAPSTTLGPDTPDEDIFFSILNQEFWEFLAEETNKYYRKELALSKTQENMAKHPRARISAFKETDAEEIKVFIGLSLFMGLSKKTDTSGIYLRKNLY